MSHHANERYCHQQQGAHASCCSQPSERACSRFGSFVSLQGCLHDGTATIYAALCAHRCCFYTVRVIWLTPILLHQIAIYFFAIPLNRLRFICLAGCTGSTGLRQATQRAISSGRPLHFGKSRVSCTAVPILALHLGARKGHHSADKFDFRLCILATAGLLRTDIVCM